MKTNDFSYFIHKYLVDYLPKECGASENTIDTYRYNFIQFFYFLDSKGIKPEKITIKDIDRTLVIEYLNWLESEKTIPLALEIVDWLYFVRSADF